MKKKQFNKYIFLIISIIIFSLFNVPANIFSQYIEEDTVDENDKEDIKKEIDKETKKDGTLPPYIAYNIKAIKVPFMNDSVRISWNINPNYDDEFIIGRANEIIDTKDRALAAESITVINSRSKNIYIDEGLKPGTFYYVIIGRDKIFSKNIDLYKDINYTSIPVNIEAVQSAADQVSKIFAKSIGDNKVHITWMKIPKQGVVYHVYRSDTAIDSAAKLKGARRVGTSIDSDEYVDQVSGGDELLYYAVAIKDSDGVEKFQPSPEQNYTSSSVRFVKKIINIVSSISAALLNSREVELKWSYPGLDSGSDIGGYVIYRSKELIDGVDKLNSAVQIDSVSKNILKFIDKVNDTGSYYYAVFVKFKDGVINISLKKNENYTITPVIVSDKFEIISISAEPSGDKIGISWNFSGVPIDDRYKIYRIRNYTENLKKIRESDIIDMVSLKAKKFIDIKPPKGGFYYGLIPEKGVEKFQIKKGVNITGSPVSLSISKRKKIDKSEEQPSGEVEEIIKNTFFKGYYREAIKELKNVVKRADNESDTAKAILFIGRSWIEIGDYKEALNYLLLKEVIRFFPEEAGFWKEFAAIRLKK